MCSIRIDNTPKILDLGVSINCRIVLHFQMEGCDTLFLFTSSPFHTVDNFKSNCSMSCVVGLNSIITTNGTC